MNASQAATDSKAPALARGSRSAWFVGALLLVVLGCTVVGARLVLHTARQSHLEDLDRRMTLDIQYKVAAIGMWFGAFSGNAANFAATDLVRLFATEAQDKQGRWSGLARHQQFIKSQLAEFSDENNFAVAALFLDARGPALQWGAMPPQDEALARDVRHVLEHGEVRVRPIRLNASGYPVLDMLLPIFAPRYVDASGRKCVGVLLAGMDISSRLRQATTPAGNSEISTLVLQYLDGGMYTVPVAATESGTGSTAAARLLGNDWHPVTVEANTPLMLPLLARTPPSSHMQEPVLARGMAVPGLPWFVAATLPERTFDASYSDFRLSVLSLAGLVAALMAFILFILWWRLFERRDRMTVAEMRRLYRTVNRQKQLLEGIHAAVGDGVALCAADGRLLYANAAFAAMAGESVEMLHNRPCRSLLVADLGRSLEQGLSSALKAGTAWHATETLSIRGEQKTCLVSGNPFTAEVGARQRDEGVVLVYHDVTEVFAMQARTRLMLDRTVQAFVRAVEAVDPYLYGHSARMSALASLLADRMERPELKPTLVVAARLSQVGMVRLPRHLLTKTGAYTPEERADMKMHVGYTREILEGIDFGMPVQEAVAHMYERMDGSGYPLGLEGESICLEGRILGLVSAFCAMVRPRTYRAALSLEYALLRLEKQRAAFDRSVMNALHGLLHTGEGTVLVKKLVVSHTPENNTD